MLSKKGLNVSPSPTLAIDSKAKELQSQGIDVISFGAGEPDFDTPAHIREAAIRAIQAGHTRYTPASGTLELKESICRKLKRENGLEYNPGEIVVSNGAKHSLSNAFAAVLNPGDEVIIPAPFWVSYPEMVKLNDGIPVPLHTEERNRFKVTVSQLKKAWTPKTKALVINSPSNPTGQVYSRDELEMIGYFCYEHEIFIVSDEIYERLVYEDLACTSIAALGEYLKKLTIVINGVSKSYAMTGWRIGYSASSPEIARVMAAIQSHATSNPNSIAQKAALAAMEGPQDCLWEMLEAFDQRRSYMYARILKMPFLKALEPKGAFYIFADISETLGRNQNEKTIKDSDDFAARLLAEQKVAVIPGTGFGTPHCIRLSYAASLDSIREGLDRLEAFLETIT